MYFGHAVSGLKDNVFQTSNKGIPANLYFYIALLYDYNTRSRYLKIGTAKKLSQRYDLKSPIGRKYRLCGNHNYTHVRILSAVSVEKDKAYSMENEAREVIKKMKGFVYVPNDRFRYFLLPQTIELPENEFTFVLDKNEYGEKYKIYGRFA